MPDTDARSQFAAARDSFRAAIERVSDRWDEAGLEPEEDPAKPWANGRTGDAWSPRQVVEHALSVDEMVERGLRALLGETVEQPEMEPSLGKAKAFPALESPAAALDYLDEGAALMTTMVDAWDAGVLATETELPPGGEQYVNHYGFEASEDLAGRLAFAAAHWADHAQQLETFASGG